MRGVFEAVAEGKRSRRNSAAIPYDEAIRTMKDKGPTLRKPDEMQPVTDHFSPGSGFKVLPA